MKKHIVYYIACGLIIGLLGCGKEQGPDEQPEPNTPTERIIKFSGFDWFVRNNFTSKAGPGPNFFSDSEDNVWVDAEGRLHLKITQRGGNWYCSGISLKNSLSYGKYTFYINSDVTTLDQNVVAGLFTYLNDNEEIDIEFSKWSNPNNQNSQFAVQPSDASGNKYRYDLAANLGPTRHIIDWKEDKIAFESAQILPEGVTVLDNWEYTGIHIPKDKDERLKLNLWLFRGQMPTDMKEQEIVFDKVTYEPH